MRPAQRASVGRRSAGADAPVSAAATDALCTLGCLRGNSTACVGPPMWLRRHRQGLSRHGPFGTQAGASSALALPDQLLPPRSLRPPAAESACARPARDARHLCADQAADRHWVRVLRVPRRLPPREAARLPRVRHPLLDAACGKARAEEKGQEGRQKGAVSCLTSCLTSATSTGLGPTASELPRTSAAIMAGSNQIVIFGPVLSLRRS